jgi:hypothetical protein
MLMINAIMIFVLSLGKMFRLIWMKQWNSINFQLITFMLMVNAIMIFVLNLIKFLNWFERSNEIL